jgi:hypothetical protein
LKSCRQHYLQACQQGAVILYWGYYWREVYHAAPLIAAQLLFAYGFDSFLSWTHRRKFVLGFGPFPIDLYFLQDGYCEDGSGWACNELGILLAEHYGNRRRAAMDFERACGLGFSAGCDNTSALTQGDKFRRDAPTVADYRFILRGSKDPFPDREPAQLYARACVQGWPDTCGIQ